MKIIKIILAAILFIGVQQLIELKTRGFCLQKIQATDLPYQTRWETPPLSAKEQEKIDAMLWQPYFFLGAGSECFAFLSADGKTVIKFFKLDHARPVYIHRGLLLEDHTATAGTLSTLRSDVPLIKRIFGMREFRLLRTFSSIKLAYEELKQETGLIYLHLNPTENFKHQLTIFDACHIAHQIDLDSAKFVIQQRAVPLEQQLSFLKKNKMHGLAKTSIDSLLQMIKTRCEKGFADRDVRNRNFGFIGMKAIEIDSGSFIRNARMRETSSIKQEIFFATLELKEWLQDHYPEMAVYLDEKVSLCLHDQDL